MAKSTTFEALLENVTKAKANLDAVKAKLNEALADVELGHVVQLEGIAHQVVDIQGKRRLQCMFTKRQLAALRGEAVPARTTRRKKSDAEKDTERTAE